MIEWTKDYSVQIEHLDQEHQSLFAALNRFYDGLQKCATNDNLEILLTDLIKYAGVHFQNEEAFMEKIGFHGLEAHKKAHAAFAEQAADYLHRYKKGTAPASYEVTHFLMDWITQHIKREDMQYAKFAGKK